MDNAFVRRDPSAFTKPLEPGELELDLQVPSKYHESGPYYQPLLRKMSPHSNSLLFPRKSRWTRAISSLFQVRGGSRTGDGGNRAYESDCKRIVPL